MGRHSSNMLHQLVMTAVFTAIIQCVPQLTATGQSHTIKIRVPHTYHHHTHTKFVPVPANNTSLPPGVYQLSQIPPGTPVIPGPIPGTYLLAPPGTPGVVIQPGQPGTILPPGVLPGGLPVPGQFPAAFPVQPGQAFPQQPGFPPQGQAPPGFPQGFPPFGAMYVNGDYEYIDMNGGKQEKEKIGRADDDARPQKIKNIINIQGSKDVPLMELLDIGQMYNKQSSGRIKVDVTGDKAYIRHKKMGRRKAARDPISYYDIDRHQYDEEDELDESSLEFEQDGAETAQWVKVKELLENHLKAESPERTKSTSAEEVKSHRTIKTELRPVGYIVIGQNNEKRFLPIAGEDTG